MAQKVQILLTDDTNGEPADETVSFSLDGTQYEIDLTEKNAKSLRDALGPWVTNGRRVGGRRQPARAAAAEPAAKRGRNKSDVDLGAVRAWARENGHQVSDRGRVSATVLAAYEAAN